MTEPGVAVTTAPCSVCGKPIPMQVSEYKEMLALGAPIMHREHTETSEAPVLKSYRAVVHIFEVAEPGAPEELVAAATARAQAVTLRTAFDGPLSEDLQQKWWGMAEKSSLADLPSGGDSTAGK